MVTTRGDVHFVVTEFGVAALHGRTVRQRYAGPSCWTFLREVKQHYPHHIILGSGDLFTAQDCLRMIAQTQVDGVTVARGAIGNPWIFAQARALADGAELRQPTIDQQRSVLREHYRLAELLYGADRCGPLMRKFGIKYALQHPQPLDVRAAFTRIRTRADWDQLLRRWYA